MELGVSFFVLFFILTMVILSWIIVVTNKIPDEPAQTSKSTPIEEEKTEPLEGLKPFIPNRLEWLAFTMNAVSRVSYTRETHFSMFFVPSNSDNSIRLIIKYDPNVDRATMNKCIEWAKNFIVEYSKEKGWISWIKVEEDVKMVESEK